MTRALRITRSWPMANPSCVQIMSRGRTYPLSHPLRATARREKAGASARLARARLTETAFAFLQVAGCSERPAIITDGGLFRVCASLTLYVAGCVARVERLGICQGRPGRANRDDASGKMRTAGPVQSSRRWIKDHKRFTVDDGGEFCLGDFQVQSGEVIRDARLIWKRPCPASLADRSCMDTARRYPDAAFLKASVRRWLE